MSPCQHRACPHCWQTYFRKAITDYYDSRVRYQPGDPDPELKFICPFCRQDLSAESDFIEDERIDIGSEYYKIKHPLLIII